MNNITEKIKSIPNHFETLILVSVFTCFISNLLRGNNWGLAVINSLTLFFCWKLVIKISKIDNIIKVFPEPFWVIVFIFIGLTPLFNDNRFSYFVGFCQLLSLALMLIADQKLPGKILVIAAFLIIILGSLVIVGIVVIPSGLSLNSLGSISLNRGETIFANDYSRLIVQHRNEFVLPNRINFLIYNDFVFIPYFFGNLSRFMSLQNFSEELLWGNLYPLIMGIYIYFKNYYSREKIVFFWMLISMLIISVSTGGYNFVSLYFAAPILLFFIFLGLLSKLKVKLYISLLFISFFLMLALKR